MIFLPDIERAILDSPSESPAPYTPPAIIYEGVISTRAGSTLSGTDDDEDDSVDPADLFSD